MCAIIDASVLTEIVGDNRTPAGIGFLDWITNGEGKVIYGGSRQLAEYKKVSGFAELIEELDRQNLARQLDKSEVDSISDSLVKQHPLRSKQKDSNVLAIAILSGARMLFSNDKPLHEDFKNTSIISPKGKVFSTNNINYPNDNKDFTREKADLLRNNPCR